MKTEAEKRFLETRPMKPRIWRSDGAWKCFWESLLCGWIVCEAPDYPMALAQIRRAYQMGDVRE